MKTVFFAPYGRLHPEVGFLFVLARYLQPLTTDLMQLRCDGMLQHCGRDDALLRPRGLRSCFECMREQRDLAQWAGLPLRQLGMYLTPDEVRESEKWVMGLQAQELLTVEYLGLNLFQLSRLPAQSGGALPEAVVRQRLLGTLRLCLSMRRFLSREQPRVVLYAHGDDSMSRVLDVQAARQQQEAFRFGLDSVGRSLQVRRRSDGAELTVPLVVEALDRVRTDVKSWPKELVSQLDEVLAFIGFGDTQLILPMAR